MELILTLPIVLLLMVLVLAVRKAYLVRQRACVAARHCAWRGAQTGDVPSRAAVRAMTGNRRADLSVEWVDARSGYGLGTVTSGLGVFSVDMICPPLGEEPVVTLDAPVRFASEQFSYAGRFHPVSTLERGFWVTPRGREGLFGFFLPGIVQRLGIDPFRP